MLSHVVSHSVSLKTLDDTQAEKVVSLTVVIESELLLLVVEALVLLWLVVLWLEVVFVVVMVVLEEPVEVSLDVMLSAQMLQNASQV